MRYSRSLIFCTMLVSSFVGCMSTGSTDLNNDRWGKPAGSPQGEAYSRFLAGVLLENQGQFDAAIQEMSRVPELDPNAVTPVLRLIRAHLRERDYESALNMAERAVEQQPDAANLWIVLGEIQHQLRDFDAAVEAFSKAIELSPDNLMGYGALAEVQESANDLVAAIDIYEKLIVLKPDAAVLHYQLGTNLMRINDAEGAIRALERALELNSNLVRAQYLLSALYLQSGANEKAIAETSAYLRRRPNDLPALENLAGAYGRVGQFDESIAVTRRILSSSSADTKHHLHGMYVLLRANQPAAAEQIAPPSGAPNLTQFFVAMAREAQNLPYLPVLESLDDVEGDLGAEVSTHISSLLYYYDKEQVIPWLFERLERYRKEAPDVLRVAVIEGRLHMLAGDYRAAVEVLTPLLLDAEGEEERELHYYLAVSHEELDHFDNTEEHLKAYLNFAPDDPDVLNFLGYFYAEQGVKLEESENLLRKALDLDPGNPFFLDSLGWTYFKMGRVEEAIDLIQEAIYGMESDDAVLRDHLGDAYRASGDLERALSEWERAHRLDPELEGVAEKIEEVRPHVDGTDGKGDS